MATEPAKRVPKFSELEERRKDREWFERVAHKDYIKAHPFTPSELEARRMDIRRRRQQKEEEEADASTTDGYGRQAGLLAYPCLVRGQQAVGRGDLW